MPAIGPQTITYSFYFTLDFAETEENSDYVHNLNFVTRKYNVAASLDSYEEFLYNEKGQLIFYYQQLETVDNVLRARCYFLNNKLVKFSLKELIEEGEIDNSADYKEIYNSIYNIPEIYFDEYISISSKSNQIKNLYHMIDEVVQ